MRAGFTCPTSLFPQTNSRQQLKKNEKFRYVTELKSDSIKAPYTQSSNIMWKGKGNMPLDERRWFKFLVLICSYGTSVGCFLLLAPLVNENSLAYVALLVLVLCAQANLAQIFRELLGLIVVAINPQIDSASKK